MTIRWLSTEAKDARRHLKGLLTLKKFDEAQYWLGYAHACEMAITKARTMRKRPTRRRAR